MAPTVPGVELGAFDGPAEPVGEADGALLTPAPAPGYGALVGAAVVLLVAPDPSLAITVKAPRMNGWMRQKYV
jgi:hypothetical protein